MPPTASRRPGRPPAAKADETRERILQAAREVFSERCYEGATFEAIAVRAELTRSAINHYFSSKRVLYREVVDQTNELVVAAGIEQAQRETTLMGRLTAFICNAKRANIENPSTSAFMVTAALESQRHPELNRAEHVSVPTSRDFLMWAVNDAIERGEIATDIDASALVETLLVVLCGVGFYAGSFGATRRWKPSRRCCAGCWKARSGGPKANRHGVDSRSALWPTSAQVS